MIHDPSDELTRFQDALVEFTKFQRNGGPVYAVRGFTLSEKSYAALPCGPASGMWRQAFAELAQLPDRSVVISAKVDPLRGCWVILAGNHSFPAVELCPEMVLTALDEEAESC